MALTDKDVEDVLKILEDTSDSFPTSLQQDNENEVHDQDFDMVNVYDPSAVSGDSTRNVISKIGFQAFGVPLKRSSEVFELQDVDIPKRKCIQKVHPEPDGIIKIENDLSTTYITREEERTPRSDISQLGEMVNHLLCRASTTDQRISNMEQEMKCLKSANMRLTERVEHLEVNGLCFLCTKDKISIWVNPCKHWVMCVACFKALREARNANNRSMECPICRETIDFAVPFFGINDEVIQI